ncbi:MAG: hypothetical protein ACFE7A_06540 [Promethearchaeota archaeon]
MLVSKRGLAIYLLFALALASFIIQAYFLAQNVNWYQILPEFAEHIMPSILIGIVSLLIPIEMLLIGMILVSLHFSRLDSDRKQEK